MSSMTNAAEWASHPHNCHLMDILHLPGHPTALRYSKSVLPHHTKLQIHVFNEALLLEGRDEEVTGL